MKGKFAILLAGGFVVLSTLAAATGNFAVRLETAARETAAATQAANPAPAAPERNSAPAGNASTPSGALSIARIALADGAATAYGQYPARSSVITTGTQFHIYYEPVNLATRFANGQIQASMSVDILVRNARNETVAVRDNAWQLPINRASATAGSLTQLYGDLTVNGLTFPDGRYQIVLRIHDDFAGTFVDRVLNVELRRQAAAPAARVSQSTAAAPGRTQ